VFAVSAVGAGGAAIGLLQVVFLFLLLMLIEELALVALLRFLFR
jgi:hypothetical protein